MVKENTLVNFDCFFFFFYRAVKMKGDVHTLQLVGFFLLIHLTVVEMYSKTWLQRNDLLMWFNRYSGISVTCL